MKAGDIVIVVPSRKGATPLRCYGKPGTLLTVSKVDGEWISIYGFPQDGSYSYRSVNFELANFTLENE